MCAGLSSMCARLRWAGWGDATAEMGRTSRPPIVFMTVCSKGGSVG